MAENEPQYFAEYSLWNDSAYSMFSIHPFNRIEFMRPVAGSIFLSPADLVQKDKDSSDEVEAEQDLPPQPRVRNSPGFERYIRRAFKVVTREDLTRDPAMFRKDPESDDSDSSLDRMRNRDMYLRPPRPRWRTPQQVNGRGRRKNLMQRRLEQALAEPAKIERGASMMHRMGWSGGALGRGGGGIVEPIAPNPYYVQMLNAAYAQNAGLGLALDSGAESSDSETAITKRCRSQLQTKSKKIKKQEFIWNVLQYIREFVKNDLQVEMFFEPKLNPGERRTIHQVVGTLMNEESGIEFERIEMMHIVEDIERRNSYILGTVSKGDAPQRQICIYKEATESMYLVTPDDVRYRDEEETNPFLKSIARHLHSEDPREYTMLDRMIDFFVEFSEEDAYTEFRFLGAFNIDEIDVISSFFGMVTCLIDKTPYLDYPERLVQAFEKGVDFTASEDANGYISIKKIFRVKDEEEKDKHEEKDKTDEKDKTEEKEAEKTEAGEPKQ